MSTAILTGPSVEGNAFPAGYWVSRALVFTLALILLIVLLPLGLAVGVWIFISSPGPVLYLQTRVGKGGRHFTIVKFRTLKVGTEKPHDHVLKGDSRLIYGGEWLRRTHIDELAQLLNILAGTMTFIGPRPDTVEKTELRMSINPEHRFVLEYLPGLACSSCVKDKWENIGSFEATKMDLEYVRHATWQRKLKLLGSVAAKVARNLIAA